MRYGREEVKEMVQRWGKDERKGGKWCTHELVYPAGRREGPEGEEAKAGK